VGVNILPMDITLEPSELGLDRLDFLRDTGVTITKEMNAHEISRAFKKLSDKDVALVMSTLIYKGPLNFKEIGEYTELPHAKINHILTDTKNLNLIIRIENRKYTLTKYGVILFNSLHMIMDTLGQSEDLFIPPNVRNE